MINNTLCLPVLALKHTPLHYQLKIVIGLTRKQPGKKFREFLESKHRNPTAYYKSRGVTFATKIDGKIVLIQIIIICHTTQSNWNNERLHKYKYD